MVLVLRLKYLSWIIFLRKKCIYNRYENTYTERTRSTLLFWKISLRFIILLIENIIKYKRLKYELKNNFTYLTSKTFWKKYLKIDN